MLKKRLFAALLAMLLVCSCMPLAQAAEYTHVTVSGRANYAWSQEVFRLVNENRAIYGNGAAPVVLDQELTDEAMLRAAELCVYYSHTLPCGYETPLAEAIAIGQGSPASAVAAWMASKAGHREAILQKQFEKIGVGSFTSNGTTAWIIVFAFSADSYVPETRNANVNANTEILVDFDYLNLGSVSNSSVSMKIGETRSYSLKARNGGFRSSSAKLAPYGTDAYDVGGNLAVDYEPAKDGSGNFTLTAMAEGTYVMKLPLYEGQSPCNTITVTVTNPAGHVHKWVGAQTKAPTTESEGELTYRCNCGLSYTSPIAKLEPNGIAFIDVDKTKYYFDPVLWALEEEVTSGTSEKTFSPNATCTQGQILTFLWRAAGSPSVRLEDPYDTPLDESQYYYAPMLWAWKKGIVTDSTLLPGAPCSRIDVVTYLWCLAKSSKTGQCDFTDVAEADQPAVAWAVKKGITNGTSETTFSPEDICTRAQIVTFLYRYFK